MFGFPLYACIDHLSRREIFFVQVIRAIILASFKSIHCGLPCQSLFVQTADGLVLDEMDIGLHICGVFRQEMP